MESEYACDPSSLQVKLDKSERNIYIFYFAQFNSPLSAPARVSSAAAFVELKRSSVQGGSDHLLVTGPGRNISY